MRSFLADTENIFNLRVEKARPEFHETFIQTGYRRPGMSFVDCLRSIFIPWCNESFNVWSHALFGIYFIIKYRQIFTQELDITDPFVWPLFTFAMGMIGFCFMSAIAHTFNSMSPYLRHKCFYLDYAAISIYTVGLCQAFYFYTRPLEMQCTSFFLATALLHSVSCTFVACLARTQWKRFQYVIRTFLYTSSFLLGSSPLIYRFLVCRSPAECECPGFSLYLEHAIFLLMSAIIYATKIPERFVGLTFDCLGQSHHFFHIFTAMGCNLKFEFIKTDFLHRRGMLQEDRDVQPTVYSTLLLSVVALICNLLICYLLDPSDEGRKENHCEEKKER